MDKKEISRILEEIANLLELEGENPFKVRAYRNAARALLNSDENLKDLVKEERLTDLEGIGDHIAEKITELFKTGRLSYYEKLKKGTPKGLLELLQVHGLGPKKVKLLYSKLKIQSIDALKSAALAGKLAKIKGFGVKTEKNILDSLEHKEKYSQRNLWWDAMAMAEPILESLRKLKGVKRAEIAGSLARKLETIGDLDFLVAAANPKPVMAWFTSQPLVEKVMAKGETKSSIRLKGGFQADIRIVSEKEFAFALTYFIGSKEHNIEIRKRSIKRGWSLSEYGFELIAKGKRPFPESKIATENDIYKALGLSYIPPEIRENRGEIEAAERGKLPTLIEEKDIRGTFHNHTTASDGKSNLKEMIEAAEKRGWEYIGISDHSKSSFQANGLSEERLLAQVEEIRKFNAAKKYNIHIFSGLECDILADGSLDFPDKVLKKLDFVIASVHASLTQDEKTMTRRIIKAVEHPRTTMLGHLTGRLLLKREPYKINIPKVIDACIANKKIIELNGNPMRLDMDWRFWHSASERGLLCCINTDAHAADQHAFIRAGVNSARKGWLEKRHVLNASSLNQVLKYLNL